MIPLRDNNAVRCFPVVTITVILINGYVFFRSVFWGRHAPAMLQRFSVIPANYALAAGEDVGAVAAQLPALITALFLHGGVLHVAGNMWYLWIFGDNVEARLGGITFFLFYIVCGVAGNVAHIMLNPASPVPLIGASGCVSGVLGAYFLLFPRARILTAMPIVFIWHIVEIRAVYFLAGWFFLQVVNMWLIPPPAQTVSVAWGAHIAGFAAGCVLILLLPKKKQRYAR